MKRKDRTRVRKEGSENKSQAIVVAGFVIAIGIVSMVVILNGTIQSVSFQGEGTEEDASSAIDYRGTMVKESLKAIKEVNELSANRLLTPGETNKTYIGYLDSLSARLQKVYSGRALVSMSNLTLKTANFTNTLRIRKNQSTPPNQVARRPIDVVLVFDTSGSMADDADGDGQDKMKEAKMAAKRYYISGLAPADRAAIVDFDEDSGYDKKGRYTGFIEATKSGKERLNNTIEKLQHDDSTYLGGGLREAAELLKEDANSSHRKYVIALSDGTNTAGWLHFNEKYVYSCPTTNDYDCVGDFEWNHEWGGASFYDYGEDDWVCLADKRGDDTCDADSDGDGYPDAFDGGSPSNPPWDSQWRQYGAGTNQPGIDHLNDRDMYWGEKINQTRGTIFTIGFGDEGADCPGGDLNECHLRGLADITGPACDGAASCPDPNDNYYPATDADKLQDAFGDILDRTTERDTIAENVTSFYRLSFNLTFLQRGNFSLIMTDNQTGSKLWSMDVTNGTTPSNPSTNHSVVIQGDFTDSSPEQVIDYTKPEIGGQPLRINVVEEQINGEPVDLETHYFDGYSQGINVTKRWSTSTVNVTYDIRVDPKANASFVCGEPPCGNRRTQTVGAIQGANFTINYINNDVNYTEKVSVSLGSIDQDVPITDNPNFGTVRTLGFSTPLFRYDTYYPFDQTSTDTYSDDHVFDASLYNHTSGRGHSDAPDINDDGVTNDMNFGSFSWDRSYGFGKNEYVVDEDGWNNIPNEGSWTVSFWFSPSPTASDNDKGVIFDLSDPDSNRLFEIALKNKNLIWRYEDENGNVSRAEYDIGGIAPPGVPSIPWNADSWYHVVAVGKWNATGKTKLFVNGKLVAADAFTTMAGKPMQETAGSGGLSDMVIGDNANGVGDSGSTSQGFAGRIDDLRIYDTDLSNLSLFGSLNTVYQEDFDNGGAPPPTWSFDSDAGVYSGTSSSGSYSAYIGESFGTTVTSPEKNLSSYSSVFVKAWIRKGDDSFSEDPDGNDELWVEYKDSSGSWNTLKTYDPDNYADGEVIQLSKELPPNGIHPDSQVRFLLYDGEGAGYDYWHIDDFEFTTASYTTGGNVGYIDELYNDTAKGYIYTPWKNYTDSTGNNVKVDSGRLRLADVVSENNSGNVTIWVESDNASDGNSLPNEVSDRIVLDESASYNVTGLSKNFARYRLKIRADHYEARDAPKFFKAKLKSY